MKKFISKLICFLLLFSMLIIPSGKVYATSNASNSSNASKDYHIAIVTPTLSTSEDEFRAGEAMAQKYPEIVKHLTLPEKFDVEIENCISTIVSAADDPKMKAIIVSSGQSGLIPAFQQVKAKNPDILTIAATVFDEPEMMSKYIDVILDTNWIKRGETIPTKAKEMGAKTFIHYSFPTHLAKPLISARKEMMKKSCEKLGMTFVEVVTPDPQTGDSVEAMQQFLREDLPRQIQKYGKDTNVFGSNCPMYDVILDEAFKEGFMVAEQCCPTPTQAYPTVLGLEIEKEDSTNFDKINQMIKDKVKEKGMSGRFANWPMPVTIFIPELAVEVAMAKIENGFNPNDLKALNQFSMDKFNVKVDFTNLEDNGKTYDNFHVVIMESILY